MEYLKQFLLMLLMGLIVREIAGDISRFSHWLVRAAARRLPSEERERFIDENLADIDAIEGPFSKLYTALGCFSAATSLIDEYAVASSDRNAASSPHKSGVRLLAIPLLAPAIWNLYTTFRGLADFFDLPSHPSINPGQFALGIAVTIIVIGFVIASRPIWSFVSEEPPFLLLKAVSVTCILINTGAAWVGMKHVMSFGDADPGKSFSLAFVVALTVLSMIGLSKLLFDADDGDKPLLS
jgi:hypothetical protein